MSFNPAEIFIVNYPAEVLRRPTSLVSAVDDNVRSLARRMIALMYEAEGIGLAAPQVGVSLRLFVVDVPEASGRSATDSLPSATNGPQVYINPVLSEPSGPAIPADEGCLSLPGIRGDVMRPEEISITALDLDGRERTMRGTGLLARCWQHEFDHLEGTLIIDRMVQRSRMKNRSRLRDLERADR